MANNDKLYHYPPLNARWWAHPRFLTNEEVQHMLKTGIKVFSADSRYIGGVGRILTHNRTGEATHLVISTGIALDTEKIVPAAWIKAISEKKIILAIELALLMQLPSAVPE